MAIDLWNAKYLVIIASELVAQAAIGIAYGFWPWVILTLIMLVAISVGGHYARKYNGDNIAMIASLFEIAVFIVGLTAVNKDWGSTAVAVVIVCMVMALLSPSTEQKRSLRHLFGFR